MNKFDTVEETKQSRAVRFSSVSEWVCVCVILGKENNAQRHRIVKMMPTTSFNMLTYSKTYKSNMQSKSRSGRRCGDNVNINGNRANIRGSSISRRSDNIPPSKHRNFDGYSNQSKAKLSITTGKCSSINPYRIFILLVIGFPGLNNGKPNQTDSNLLHVYFHIDFISFYFVLLCFDSFRFV